MADNVPITAGSGTSIAADDISSVFYQRVKIALGAADAVDMDLDSGQQTMANSVPVALASNQSVVPVSLPGELAAQVIGGGAKTDTTDQSIMAAAASNYNYLCWVTVYNASTTNTYVNLKDGSTVRAVIPLPAYGGAVLMFPRPLRSTVNTAWNLAAGASVTTAHLYGGGYQSTA